MNTTKHTLNELLVGLFNYILYIEEKNLQRNGVKLSMNEVHILESIDKASDNTMSHIAGRLMVTQGTLTTNVAKLINKGYVIKYQDEEDRRINRLKVTDAAKSVLMVHEAFHENMIDKALDELQLGDDEVLIQTLENILAYFRDEYRDIANI